MPPANNDPTITMTFMKKHIEESIKSRFAPDLRFCTAVRANSPEDAQWIDQLYVDNGMADYVGDDLSGLVTLLSSHDDIRKTIAECKKEEVIPWFRLIKGLD